MVCTIFFILITIKLLIMNNLTVGIIWIIAFIVWILLLVFFTKVIILLTTIVIFIVWLYIEGSKKIY